MEILSVDNHYFLIYLVKEYAQVPKIKSDVQGSSAALGGVSGESGTSL